MNYEDLMQKLDEYRDYVLDVLNNNQNFLKYIWVGVLLLLYISFKSCGGDTYSGGELTLVDNFDDGIEIIDNFVEDNIEEYLDLCRITQEEYNNWTNAKQSRMRNKKTFLRNKIMGLNTSLRFNESLSRDEQNRISDYLFTQVDKIDAECDKLMGFN